MSYSYRPAMLGLFGWDSVKMRGSPNQLVTLRQCHKCGAIDSGLDLTLSKSYEVTADSCEKCGWEFDE